MRHHLLQHLLMCVVLAATATTSGCCTFFNGGRWLFGCIEPTPPAETEIAKKFPLDTPTSTFEAFKFSIRVNNATLCHRYILAGEVRDSVPFADFSVGWDEKIQTYKQVALEAWIERVERVRLAGKDGKPDGRAAAIVHCIANDGRREKFLLVEERPIEPDNAFWLVGPGGDANAVATSGGTDSPTDEIETDSPYPEDNPTPEASPAATESDAEPEPDQVKLLEFMRWRMIFPSHFQRESTWFPEIAEMIREAEAETIPEEQPPGDGENAGAQPDGADETATGE